MADIPKVDYRNLAALIKPLAKASTAVREGIATHAEKEHAARMGRLKILENERRMAEHKVIDVTQL